MNRGIELSTADLVAILGAHTLYPDDYLATCQELLTEHPDADCSGGRSRAGAAPPSAGPWPSRCRTPRAWATRGTGTPGYEGYAEGACFPVFRRAALLRTGLYDTALVRNQDDDLNYRFRKAGGRVFISHRARCVYFVRESAGALFRQYYQYGAWRLRVLRKHGEVASWRQLAPVVFYAWLCLSIVLTPVVASALRVWLWAPALAYGAMLVTTLLLSAPTLGWPSALRVPLAMATMHFAYALGFASALFRRPST